MDSSTRDLVAVFADLPHVMFCLKASDGRYLAANASFVRRAGVRSAAEVVGRRATDLFPAPLAAAYVAQDRAVFTTGRPVRFQFEIIASPDGGERWFLTSKRLVGSAGEQVGTVLSVVSVEANLSRSGDEGPGVRRAIDYARAHFATPIRVEELAVIASMSTQGLERVVRRTLGVSPKQFVQRLRIDHAATLLATTDQLLAEIATACGFYDQSQLTRVFRAQTGLTPGAYRAGAKTANTRSSRS
ncbi:MAG: helix-turn-helix domain-containing protein [Nocardioides sp.]